MNCTSRQPMLRPIVVPLLAAVAIAFGTGAEAAENGQSLAADDGFVPLLKGDKEKTWVGYGKDSWPEGWELTEGVLHRSGSGGDLQTVEEFGDFDLRFAWKISPGGNSGVMYRVSREKGPAYFTGPEYQLLDNAKHQDGKSPLTSTASLYALYAPTKDVAKPAGQWNRSRIVIKGSRIRHFLNGEKVVDVELGSDDWTKRVAESKFAAWPKFGKNQKGHIVLQDHGDEVWYRSMRIKRLDGKEDAPASK
jgi:hypothetical protein